MKSWHASLITGPFKGAWFNQPIRFCLGGCKWARVVHLSRRGTPSSIRTLMANEIGKKSVDLLEEFTCWLPYRVLTSRKSQVNNPYSPLHSILPSLFPIISPHTPLSSLPLPLPVCSGLREGIAINICLTCYLIHYGIAVNLIWYYFNKIL